MMMKKTAKTMTLGISTGKTTPNPPKNHRQVSSSLEDAPDNNDDEVWHARSVGTRTLRRALSEGSGLVVLIPCAADFDRRTSPRPGA